MAIRGAIATSFKPAGACDAIDGSSAPDGAMASLMNLIPNPKTSRQFVPRPAATQLTNFAGFTTPAQVEALLVIGSRAYGMIASARFAGKDEPFCYDLVAGAFIAIANVTAADCPTSQAATGAWTPPTMAMVANRILITHPGYSGANKIGWIDLRAFTLATLTGSTHSNTTLDTLSGNPITLGVGVGDRVTGAGIPANTFVVSMTAAAVVLSQAATATAAGVAITFAGGTRAAPIYGAGDTNGTALVGVPTAVAAFNGRAYFAVANGLQFTDSLVPWQITAATQALTLGDDQAVTALTGLPLNSQFSGVVIQSLVAFKGAAPYWQITGDSATTDLKSTQVQGSVGTLAPLSIAATPRGLAYIAIDGLRIIDPISARCSDPLGSDGLGINTPFIYAVVPSRIAAAFNKNVYRASVQNGAVEGQPTQDWWYHFSLGVWSGPHTLPAGLIAPCNTGDGDFIFAAIGVDAKLFLHTISPSQTSTYTENGSAMTVNFTTTLLPDNQQDSANQIVESDIGLVMPSSQALAIQATDEQGNVLAAVALTGDGNTAGLWGSMTWGGALWGGAVKPFQQFTLPWPNPIVFKQMALTISGQAAYGLVIGSVNTKYQILKYQGGYP